MYQVPVGGLEKIRKTRTKVKHILSDIGLEDCQNFLEELQNSDPVVQNSDPGDDVFLETEWTDFTEGFNGRMRKKWIYRTEAICCRMCEYQTRNWRNFKYHLQRNHDYERNVCALSPCPLCPFVGHPKIVRKHIALFHSNSQTPAPPPPLSLLGVKKGERYRCQKCTFQTSVLFAVEKHVLLTHLGGLLSRFSCRAADAANPQTHSYYCKECDVSLQNLDHMLQHVLVTPAHQSINWHVKPYIIESTAKLRRYGGPVFASNTQHPQVLSSGLLFPLPNDQQAGKAPPLPQPGPPLLAAGVPGAPNSGSFMCAPQMLLPPQASALVQLASAEAKGLLKPGSAITFRSALPPGAAPTTFPLPGGISPGVVRLAALPSSVSKQLLPPLPLATPGPQPLQPWPQQVLLPKVNMLRSGGGGPPPLTATPRLPLNQTTPQGTMLTSQSLLDHLIPTGNRINGKPTYTLAPLEATVPVGKAAAQNTAPQPAKPTGYPFNQQAKRWVACPVCNELFPSDVYEVHTEVAHKAASKREALAAKAPFLKKMPDKTVQCLVCKVLVSEKGLLEHLLHGLDCIFCPHKFNSIKKLVEHSKDHNPSQKAYCEFIRREYRLYTNDSGQLMFPYFDINTSAPKEVLGDAELNLALVTKSLDLIFLKMLPSSRQASTTPLAKTVRTCCLFCDEDCETPEKYQQHLREKHFVDTAVHVVLKTTAFKCIYCNGIYTGGRVTQKGIAFHLQRCPRVPKAPTNTVKAPASTEKPLTNGQVFLPAPPKRQPVLMPAPKLPLNQAPLFYFTQLPQAPVPSPVPKPPPSLEPPQSEAEKLSKLRLEMAWKKAMDANRQEREARVAERDARRLRQEEARAAAAAAVAAAAAAQPPPQPVIPSNPARELAPGPSGVEQRPGEDRKDFITRYFHRRPYLTRKETDELSRRLSLTKSEVSMLFSNKRTKCTRTMSRKKAAVLMGFNMAELNRVKHNLLIPDVRRAEPEEAEELVQSAENKEKEKSGHLDRPGDVESMEESEKTSSRQREVEDKSEGGAEADRMAF